jgi:hypothetical protein
MAYQVSTPSLTVGVRPKTKTFSRSGRTPTVREGV